MIVEKDDVLHIQTSEDVVRVRQEVRTRTLMANFSLVEQTKLITAASEIARNTVIYGGGGTLRLQILQNNRRGVRLIFEDNGPGIADIERALTDGFSTGHGMGLGLGGAKRLANEFDITSEVGKGTKVTLVRWK